MNTVVPAVEGSVPEEEEVGGEGVGEGEGGRAGREERRVVEEEREGEGVGVGESVKVVEEGGAVGR